MSPYRVYVKCSNGSTKILAAMLSQNVISDSIYVIEKYDRNKIKGQMSFVADDTDEEIAYAMTTSRNSTILQKYVPIYVEHNRKYRLEYENKHKISKISETYRTLSKCLEGAMRHYCHTHKYSIIKVL